MGNSSSSTNSSSNSSISIKPVNSSCTSSSGIPVSNQEYDEIGNLIYWKDSIGKEGCYKYDKYNNRIIITKKEFEEIELEKEQKKKRNCFTRFEIMEI